MPTITVIAHNIRSTHNVGSIFRTCEGFGVERIILSGYTPYPKLSLSPSISGQPASSFASRTDLDANRLPHIAEKLTAQIHKTALGTEEMVPFIHQELPDIAKLRADGYRIVGLEQDARSIPLPNYEPSEKVVLLLGEEVHGIPSDLLMQCDDIIEIPMQGQKESFNVSVAAGIALYALSEP